MDRVSVIITSYNQEPYLREAVESVLNQTRRPDQIIIADDHSTKDNSIETIQRYAAEYPGLIQPVLQKENVGIPRNRNSALRLVTGDYVAILDGDDRFLPNNIETQLAALAKHPEASCSYSNRYFIDEKGHRTGIRNTKPMPSGDIVFHIACGIPGILRSMIGRYDLIRQAGFLDETFPQHDGLVLTLRLATLTQFIYIDAPLMEKRDHAGGDSKLVRSNRLRAGYFEDILAEISKLTSSLPTWQKRQITKIWSRKSLSLQVMAEVEEGRKCKALFHIARALVRDPGNKRGIRNLIKKVLKYSPA